MEEEFNLIREAINAKPLTRFHVRLVLFILITMLMDGYNIQALSYAAPSMSAQWQLTPGAMGGAFSLGLVGLTLGALIFSPIADRFGAKRILLFCVVSYAILTVLTAFVPSLQWLLAARFLTGFGLGGVMPTAIALVTDYSPARLRTFVVTLSMSGFPIGGAVGGFAAASTISHFGWQAIFLFGGVVPVLMLPLLLRYLPESLHRQLAEPGERDNLYQTLEKIIPNCRQSMIFPLRDTTDAKMRQVSPVRELFQNGLGAATCLIWITFICNLLLLYFFSSWMPSLVHGFGYSLVFASLTTSIFQLAGLIGSLLLALLCDRLGKPNLVISFTMFSIIAFCLLLSYNMYTPAALIFGAAGVGFCIVGAQGASNGFVASLYPTMIRSTGIGWALGVGRLGSIVGPILGGVLIDLHTPKVMLFRLAVIPAVIGGLSMMCMPASARNSGARTSCELAIERASAR